MTSQYGKSLFKDISLWILLIFNLITIYFAITEGWSLIEIMIIYWSQSIAIGFFNVIRILQLKDFSIEGFKLNNEQPKPTAVIKILTAIFFVVHYGMFHLVYLIFVISRVFIEMEVNGMANLRWGSIILTGLMFFVSHAVSYFYNRNIENKKQNIGVLMFYPYARIIPIHFTILMGFFASNFLIGFLILKTIADMIMQKVEQVIFRRA